MSNLVHDALQLDPDSYLDPNGSGDTIKQNAREELYLRNSGLPINQLPPELLLELFLTYMCDTYATYKPWWLKLRSVCQHWNQFALSTPILWRRVSVYKSSQWLELCLRNSRETTMDVVFYEQQFPAADLCLLLPHTYRLRTLKFQTRISAEWMPVLLEILQGDLAALEILEYFPPSFKSRDISYHLALTHSRAPLLHTLDVVGTRAPSDVALLSGLRDLSLAACSTELTVGDFLSVLASNTRLEALRLESFLDKLSGAFDVPSINREGAISLPLLRKLCLVGHSMHLTSVFLSFLRTPSTLHLLLVGDLGNTTDDQITRPIARLLPPPSIRLSALPILASPTVTRVTVRVYRWFYHIHTNFMESEKGSVSLEVQSAAVDSRDSWLGEGIRDLLDAFGSARELTGLTIHGDQTYQSLADWEKVLTTFPKLENIAIAGTQGSSELWTVLQAGLDGDGDINSDNVNSEGPSGVPYPQLKRIEYSGGIEATHETCTEVLRCVRKRAERGCRLSSLELCLCHDSASYDQMKAIYAHQFQKVVDRFSYNEW
ncbi:hypothetical protein C8Q73DRAFT_789494 [Cubamyces lactineus]|nr:hypothetical protein C8Q73DRAFT_789494 [Cubamyces lactineus]